MFNIFKTGKDELEESFNEYKKQYPELSKDLEFTDVTPGTYSPETIITCRYTSGSTPIDFNTLNTITKNYYSPEARVERMLQHAKVAAEKGSWWCNIPEVGEKEIELLKQCGLRVFKKTVDNTERSQIYEEPPYLVKYSINWSDKDATPSDRNLVEL